MSVGTRLRKKPKALNPEPKAKQLGARAERYREIRRDTETNVHRDRGRERQRREERKWKPEDWRVGEGSEKGQVEIAEGGMEALGQGLCWPLRTGDLGRRRGS